MMQLKMPILSLLCFVFVSLIAGCVSAKYTHTSETTFPSKPEDCTFRVMNSQPRGDYEEIGAVLMNGSQALFPSDLSKFQEMMRKDVCRAGGDIVVVDVNGIGQYVRGIVYRKMNK